MSERGAIRWLCACLVLSGLCGLVYEVAWVRSLELIFGATTFAVATVLASFMGGLAIGAWLAGALAPRLERHHPLKVYAAFEVLIGAVALGVPLAFHALVPLYQAIWSAFQASFAVFSIVRFVLCASVLIVPTALMGATLPVVARFAAGRDAPRRVGILFAVNTCGAVVGCAAAGLFLLPALGLIKTQWLAVLLNFTAAAGALAIARKTERWREMDSGAAAAPAAAPSPAGPDVTRTRAAFLIGAYAASGAVAMMYEVAWSRFLVLVLGSSTYSYTIMLTTFLVGLTIGAWIGTRLVRAAGDALLMVGLCQLFVGIATYFGLFIAGELPYLYHLIHDAFHPSPRGLLGVQLLLSAGVMFLPTLGLGAMFPLTLGGLGAAGDNAQRLVSRAYAWNTLGAIAGSVLTGFWLIPLLGSRKVLIAGLAINTGIALAALFLVAPQALPRARRVILAGVIVAFLANLAVSAPAWRPDMLSSGIFRYADRYEGLDRAAFRERVEQGHGEFLQFEEGLTCTVAVFRTTKTLSLLVNGKPDASVAPGLQEAVPVNRKPIEGDMQTQVLVGQLPLLLAPRIDDVLLVGLGSGVTLGSILTHPVKQVDCLELEAAVVHGSRFFDSQSGAPLADPRVHLVVNDGRNDLLVRDRTYDVIISEPSNPWIPGAASLFTRDYFRIARKRLRPGGVICQWMQLYELWPQDFLAVLRSFMEVFPSVQIWRVGFDAVLVAGPEDLPLPVGQIASRATGRVRADLDRTGIQGPVELLSYFWIGGDELRRAVPPGPINTDDNMLIEFAAPLRMLSRDAARLEEQKRELATMFAGKTTGALPFLRFPESSPGQNAEFLARLATATMERSRPGEAEGYARASLALAPSPEAAAMRAAALGALGRADEAAAARAEAERLFPRDVGVRRMLLAAARDAQDGSSIRRYGQAVLALDPNDKAVRMLLAMELQKEGDHGAALEVLEPLASSIAAASSMATAASTAASPEGAALLLGRLRLEAGRTTDAIPLLRDHLARHPDDDEVRRLLAGALRDTGSNDEADRLLRPLAPDAGARAQASLDAGGMAFDANRLDAARTALDEARTWRPDDDAVLFLLARTRARQGDRDAAIGILEQSLVARYDRPWAVGYLGQLEGAAGRSDRAAALVARYLALTGHAWTPTGD
jgi:spermidine synthase